VQIVFLELSGGRPWAVLLIGAIAFLIILLAIIWAMYPRRRD
jgi:uncharacterized membrane protein YecN with MAPEG domain